MDGYKREAFIARMLLPIFAELQTHFKFLKIDISKIQDSVYTNISSTENLILSLVSLERLISFNSFEYMEGTKIKSNECVR